MSAYHIIEETLNLKDARRGRLRSRTKTARRNRPQQEGDGGGARQAGGHQGGLQGVGVLRPGAQGEAGRRLQRAVQRHPPARVRRLAPGVSGHEPRDRAEAAPEKRRRPHPLREKRASRPRGGSGQDIHHGGGRHGIAAHRALLQAPVRRAEPPHGAVGVGMAEALPRRQFAGGHQARLRAAQPAGASAPASPRGTGTA